MAAVARMERAGVPIDLVTHRRTVGRWDAIKQRLGPEPEQTYCTKRSCRDGKNETHHSGKVGSQLAIAASSRSQ